MPYGGSPYGGAPYGGGGPSNGTAVLTATLSLTANGHSTGTTPSVTFTATLALTASGMVTGSGDALLTATLSLTATATVTATVHGTATLTASLGLVANSNTIIPPYSPIGDTHTIRYWTTTLDVQYGGQPNTYPTTELPFTKVTFSKCFNQAGPFSATLNIEDEQVLNTNWINGTNPGKTFFWVIVDNQIVYGGRILNRTYNLKTQQVTITGTDFYGYWAQRLQAQDYTQYLQTYSGATDQLYLWAHKVRGIPLITSAGAPTPMIAWQILQDACAVEYTLPNLTAPFHGEGVGSKSDPDYWVENYVSPTNFMTFSAPIGQQQTVDSLLQQFIAMGAAPEGPDFFNSVGIDVATDVKLDGNGNPFATVNVCWPRYGLTAAEQGTNMQILDLSTVIDMEWNEDATAQATGIVEQLGTGAVITGPEEVDTTAIETWNYPLTQQAICHTGFTPTALSAQVLATLLQGDRDLYAYPQLAPTVTVPIFNYGTGFSLTALPFGDDIEVFNPFERQGIYGLPSVPFPPKGSNVLAGSNVMRLVRADVTIADAGVSTMVLTLNPPPGNPSPPGYL